mmetsp:Transcript_2449/g.5092  ORF Transcript_2449/g.5092 Transcript_2449/m.5092 type:complete len:455 (-) Transcript_2449:1081-2445(-)
MRVRVDLSAVNCSDQEAKVVWVAVPKGITTVRDFASFAIRKLKLGKLFCFGSSVWVQGALLLAEDTFSEVAREGDLLQLMPCKAQNKKNRKSSIPPTPKGKPSRKKTKSSTKNIGSGVIDASLQSSRDLDFESTLPASPSLVSVPKKHGCNERGSQKSPQPQEKQLSECSKAACCFKDSENQGNGKNERQLQGSLEGGYLDRDFHTQSPIAEGLLSAHVKSPSEGSVIQKVRSTVDTEDNETDFLSIDECKLSWPSVEGGTSVSPPFVSGSVVDITYLGLELSVPAIVSHRVLISECSTDTCLANLVLQGMTGTSAEGSLTQQDLKALSTQSFSVSISSISSAISYPSEKRMTVAEKQGEPSVIENSIPIKSANLPYNASNFRLVGDKWKRKVKETPDSTTDINAAQTKDNTNKEKCQPFRLHLENPESMSGSPLLSPFDPPRRKSQGRKRHRS